MEERTKVCEHFNITRVGDVWICHKCDEEFEVE